MRKPLTTDVADTLLEQTANQHSVLICRVVNAWLLTCGVESRVYSVAAAEYVTVAEVLTHVAGILEANRNAGGRALDFNKHTLNDHGNWSFDLGSDDDEINDRELDILEQMAPEIQIEGLEDQD